MGIHIILWWIGSLGIDVMSGVVLRLFTEKQEKNVLPGPIENNTFDGVTALA